MFLISNAASSRGGLTLSRTYGFDQRQGTMRSARAESRRDGAFAPSNIILRWKGRYHLGAANRGINASTRTSRAPFSVCVQIGCHEVSRFWFQTTTEGQAPLALQPGNDPARSYARTRSCWRRTNTWRPKSVLTIQPGSLTISKPAKASNLRCSSMC
jgi:hypothetical protein